VGSCVYRKKKQ